MGEENLLIISFLGDQLRCRQGQIEKGLRNAVSRRFKPMFR